MKLEESMRLVTGDGNWHNASVDGLPRIHLSDGPYGLRKQDDGKSNNDSVLATCFPTSSSVACSFDPEVVALMAESIAKEAFNEDVSILLGPGVNMKRNPLCGRNFEYFSEDPYLAGKLGVAYVNACQKLGIGTSLKHYACNSQETLRMTSNSQVDMRALREIYLKAFEMTVKGAKPATIMAAYNRINGLYATENKNLLIDILRDEWGFDGVVVSDWGACSDLTKALKAGMDLEMPDSVGLHMKRLQRDYEAGLISQEEIELHANRVKDMVLKYCVENRGRKEKYDVTNNHDIAVQIEAESAVLLKNDGILPLKPQEINIIGSLAEFVRFQGGGSSHINTNKVVNAIDAFTKLGYQVSYESGYHVNDDKFDSTLENKAMELVKNQKPTLFFGGLPDFAEGEGYDRERFECPINQQKLFTELLKVNPNVVYVSISGAPYDMNFIDNAKAILQLYLGGEGVMEACAKLIKGDTNPSGKLAETIPCSILDTPSYPTFAKRTKDIEYRESIYIGYRYYQTFEVKVKYPFGYGLSYTTFEYSNLKVEKNKAYVDVTNTGKYDGKEVVQIYVENPACNYRRSKYELKGFKKVFLKMNETKTVEIELDDFTIFDEESNKFIIPTGDYTVCASASILDIRLKEVVHIDGVDYNKDEKEIAPNYFIHQLKDLTQEDFKQIYKLELSHFDSIKKGQYDYTSSIKEIAKHSLLAKIICGITKKEVYKMVPGKPHNDPEVLLYMSMALDGTLDTLVCNSGGIITDAMAEAMLLKANGHFFKAIKKLIRG